MDTPEKIEAALREKESDLESQGWDLPHRLWAVLPDESLVLIMEVGMDDRFEPSDVIDGLVKNPNMRFAPGSVKGLLAAVEGWTYPDAIMKLMDSVGEETFSKMLDRLPPAANIPGRQEIRNVIFVDPTGRAYRSGRIRGNEQQYMAHDSKYRDPVISSLQKLLDVHPKQSVARVVQGVLDDLGALMADVRATGRNPTSVDDEKLNEFVDRILTAYRIHMPEEYDDQVMKLRKMTDGKYPRQP